MKISAPFRFSISFVSISLLFGALLGGTLKYFGEEGGQQCIGRLQTVENRIKKLNPDLSPYYRARLAASIITAADDQGMDPFLLAAIVETESTYAPDRVSHKGAFGVAGIMPLWIKATPFATTYGELREMPVNVRAGAYIYAHYARLCEGSAEGLACYNAGPGNRAAGRGYAKQVLKLADEMRAGQCREVVK